MSKSKTPDIIAELRDGGRLGVSVTELKRNIGPIINFVATSTREVSVTRQGTVVAKLVPYKQVE